MGSRERKSERAGGERNWEWAGAGRKELVKGYEAKRRRNGQERKGEGMGMRERKSERAGGERKKECAGEERRGHRQEGKKE